MMTVWEASKAFFRGLAIRFAANQRKERMKKFQELKDALLLEEVKLKSNPTALQLKAKIKVIQHQINVLLSEEIAKKIKFARQNFFENANKSGRWLAYKLRKGKEKSIIQVLRDETGLEKFKQEDLKENFYKKWYQRKNVLLENQREYLKNNSDSFCRNACIHHFMIIHLICVFKSMLLL